MTELEHEVEILRAENLKVRNEIARLSQQTQHSQPQLTIPKSIADELDKVPFHNPKENGYICVAYIAGKALGVDLVTVVDG